MNDVVRTFAQRVGAARLDPAFLIAICIIGFRSVRRAADPRVV